MRIVGGKFRGAALASPKSQKIRPTTDRTRESLFNILCHRDDVVFEDARVIDLFAGTGALGFEALSRGAAFTLFVDEGTEARGLIRTNMTTLKQNGNAKVYRRDATKLGDRGTMQPFSLAFLDPPYERGLGEKALLSLHQGEWLEDQSLVIFEEASKPDVTLPSHYQISDERIYGDTIVRLLKYTK